MTERLSGVNGRNFTKLKVKVFSIQTIHSWDVCFRIS